MATEHGDVEVPIDPQRVVVLDEYAALNALAVGVRPVMVVASFQSDLGGRILAAEGIDLQPGAAETGPNLEMIAAARPDLILYTTEGALEERTKELAAIAPAVSLPYETPWRDVIAMTAAVFGREAQAAPLIGVFERRIHELHDALAESPTSISILANTLGMPFAVSMAAPLSQVVAEAGFSRPDAQAHGIPDTTYTSAIPISPEVLERHGADVVAVMSGAYYDAEAILGIPTFQALPAVKAGHSVVVDGDMWFGPYPFAIWWLLDDLQAIHDGAGQSGIGTADDVAARWAAFQEATR
ncbi:MAG: ABC transporter substrate-binding protein [Ilumatobacteraceae bacterium]